MILKIVVIILRSIAAYTVLLLLARLIGRKIISRITFFDFVVGITLGSLAVRISLGNEGSFIMGIVSAITITALVLITDFLNLKSAIFRKLEEGMPSVLIKEGSILDYNMYKTKISISELLMLLRQKGVFNIQDVDYAIIENDGQLSVLLKPDKLAATTCDLNISKAQNKLSIDIIIDGKIIYSNLKSSNHDETWLRQQLIFFGVNEIKNVFYAAISNSDSLFVSTYHVKNGENQ
ncbi:MAG TPA: DUF421 domain-containing protein [Ruminiclostridium sp.]